MEQIHALFAHLSLSLSLCLSHTCKHTCTKPNYSDGFKLHCLFFIDKEKSEGPYTRLWLTPCAPQVIMTRYLYAEHACEFHVQRREVTGAYLHICKSKVVSFACPHLFQWTRPSVEPVFEHAWKSTLIPLKSADWQTWWPVEKHIHVCISVWKREKKTAYAYKDV